MAHFAEGGHDLLFGPRCFSGIGEVLVVFRGVGREPRATFAGIVAHGDHMVEGDIRVFGDVVAGVVRDVDAVLAHHRDGARVNTMCFNARAVHLRLAACEVLQVTVGHLAAAAIAGTENENAHQQQVLSIPQPQVSPVASFTFSVPSAFGAQHTAP